MHYFAGAAITKYHRQCDETMEIYFHSSEGWKSKIKLSVGLVSPKPFLLGLRRSAFSLCPHMTFSLCMDVPGAFFLKRISVLLD